MKFNLRIDKRINRMEASSNYKLSDNEVYSVLNKYYESRNGLNNGIDSTIFKNFL